MNRIHAAAALGALLGCTTASANHIDFIDSGPFSFSAAGGGGPATQTVDGLDPALTLGGQRDMTLSVVGPATNTASASLSGPFGAANDDDAMTYTTSAAGSFSLTNGAGGDLNANFLDIPMMTADWDRVRLDFGPGSSSAQITTSLFSREDGGTLTSTMAFAGGDNNVDFLHTGFGPAATDAFLRNIDSATFQVDASGAGTYSIESFNRNGFVPEGQVQAVPEPGSLGLMALGLGALGFAAFRRRA